MELSKRMKDITGLTFGSLTAIKPVRLSNQGTVVWEFKCACGNHTEWIGNNVVSISKSNPNPDVPSCGCIRDAKASEVNTTHGLTKHPLHAIWQTMKQRCYNPRHPEYVRYGAKGVTVCTEWLNSAEAFITWALNNGWEKGKHLDKDTLSDQLGKPRTYSPSTCCFITAKENVGYSGSRENFKHNRKIRLTPDDVKVIKQQYHSGQLNQYDLADRYGVSQASIWRVIHRT